MHTQRKLFSFLSDCAIFCQGKELIFAAVYGALGKCREGWETKVGWGRIVTCLKSSTERIEKALCDTQVTKVVCIRAKWPIRPELTPGQ